MPSKAKAKSNDTVTRGSDNVFADIGIPNPREHLLKAEIVAAIKRVIDERALTQTAAGGLLGITQPEVSRILGGHFRECSVLRLLQFLTMLDRDVEIVARARPKGSKGQIVFTTHDAPTQD